MSNERPLSDQVRDILRQEDDDKPEYFDPEIDVIQNNDTVYFRGSHDTDTTETWISTHIDTTVSMEETR